LLYIAQADHAGSVTAADRRWTVRQAKTPRPQAPIGHPPPRCGHRVELGLPGRCVLGVGASNV